MNNKFQKLKTKFIKYWLGDVTVSKHYISCLDKKDKLYTISIIPSKFKQATWFSNIDTKTIADIINKLELQNKYFYLKINHDSNIFQEYTFNRHQQKLLLTELKNIVKNEDFYIEEKE